MRFGIIVEGETDRFVYSALIQRIRNDVDHVEAIPCGGAARLRQKFAGWLKNFHWQQSSVGTVLVICDSDCQDPRTVEEELARLLEQDRGFYDQIMFPVHFYATKCMVESLLLADERAANEVARRRDGHGSAKPPPDLLEEKKNAKQLFVKMLSQARLPAIPKVYGEVATLADLDRIKQRCPYFLRFVECVTAC